MAVRQRLRRYQRPSCCGPSPPELLAASRCGFDRRPIRPSARPSIGHRIPARGAPPPAGSWRRTALRLAEDTLLALVELREGLEDRIGVELAESPRRLDESPIHVR